MESSVQASHLLQKHTKSRNPNDSYRKKPITRSPEEAMENLKAFEKQLKDSKNLAEDFAQLASEYSECGSAARGGDLGQFSKGQMQQAFEETTFAIQIGTMSEIISTDSGYHLIFRTG